MPIAEAMVWFGMENRRWSDIENVMAVNKEKEFCIKFCGGERQWGEVAMAEHHLGLITM